MKLFTVVNTNMLVQSVDQVSGYYRVINRKMINLVYMLGNLVQFSFIFLKLLGVISNLKALSFRLILAI